MNKHKGFLLMEMLVSLALMAILLAAVGTAIYAFLHSYSENDKIGSITQMARATLNQMTNDIRTADAVTASASKVSIIPPPVQGQPTPSLVEYELSEGTLFYRRTVDGTVNSYPLLAGSGQIQLKNFVLTSVMGKDSKGVDCTKSVTAKIVLSAENRVFSVTASASPRRNQIF